MKKFTMFLIFCSVVVASLSSLPASADAELVASQPGVDEVLEQAPSEIRLEFSSEVRSDDASISVLYLSGPGGDEAVIEGLIQVEGKVVTQALMPDLPEGQYFVLWDVTSLEGHDMFDSYEFAIGQSVEFPEAEAVAAQPLTFSDQRVEMYDKLFVSAVTFRDIFLAATILFVQSSVALLTPLPAVVIGVVLLAL